MCLPRLAHQATLLVGSLARKLNCKTKNDGVEHADRVVIPGLFVLLGTNCSLQLLAPLQCPPLLLGKPLHSLCSASMDT